MADLTHAHVQRSFRILIGLFIGGAVVTFGAVLYLGSVRSVVTVTPLTKTQTVTLTLTIGPTGTNTDLPGSVKQETKSATVTALPSATGTPTPDHAHGPVVIHNETNAAQPLAVGTRLQAESGVIVRTTARVDVPARGTVTVEAVADPTGTAGEIPPGRLTIVALRPGNQSVIYGQNEKTFTGGTTLKAGSLGVDELTQASNQAEAKVAAEFGQSEAGIFRTLIPEEVGIEPDADQPSAEYAVTVTVTALEATYATADLEARLKAAVEAQLADDEQLVSIDTPEIKFEERPTTDQMTVTVIATANTSMIASSPALDPVKLAGRPRAEVVQSLLGTNLVQAVDIQLRPFWRTTLPADPTKITVRLAPGNNSTGDSD